MRNLTIGGLIAAAVLMTGCTTTRGDVRDARRDLRKTRRDYRRDNRPY